MYIPNDKNESIRSEIQSFESRVGWYRRCSVGLLTCPNREFLVFWITQSLTYGIFDYSRLFRYKGAVHSKLLLQGIKELYKSIDMRHRACWLFISARTLASVIGNIIDRCCLWW